MSDIKFRLDQHGLEVAPYVLDRSKCTRCADYYIRASEDFHVELDVSGEFELKRVSLIGSPRRWPLPFLLEAFDLLGEKASERLGSKCIPRTEYACVKILGPGQGIGWHRDEALLAAHLYLTPVVPVSTSLAAGYTEVVRPPRRDREWIDVGHTREPLDLLHEGWTFLFGGDCAGSALLLRGNDCVHRVRALDEEQTKVVAWCPYLVTGAHYNPMISRDIPADDPAKEQR